MNVRQPATLLGLSMLVLSGCAAGSGIVPVGPDTYAVSEMRAPALGGGREARGAVLAEAAAFCGRQGRSPLTLTLAPSGDPFTPYYPTAFDHVFRCVPPSR